MKVIFLDNDGVICLSNNWGSRYNKIKAWMVVTKDKNISNIPPQYKLDNLDKKAVKVLNQIIELTGAEIVISSDWKHHASLDELGDYYIEQGFIKKPIDITPYVDEHERTWNNSRTDLEEERCSEIKKWLLNHPEVTHWVAIDDLNMGKVGLDNFILTPIPNEGIKQSGIKEKILKYL